MKYIVLALNDAEEIFVFHRSVDHDRMVEACEAIRFGGERNWNRKYRDGEVVAAGFVDDGVCHGRSETLDLSSRGERDTKLLAQFNRSTATSATVSADARADAFGDVLAMMAVNATPEELMDYCVKERRAAIAAQSTGVSE